MGPEKLPQTSWRTNASKTEMSYRFVFLFCFVPDLLAEVSLYTRSYYLNLASSPNLLLHTHTTPLQKVWNRIINKMKNSKLKQFSSKSFWTNKDTWCQIMSFRVSSFCWILCVQFGENRQVLQALRTLLDDFREELQEEETRRCQLQQSYANDKAAWEMKWAEMKCQVAQVQMVSQCRPP